MPKAPADHLPKLPHRVRCKVVLDNAAADIYDDAVRDLKEARADIERSLPRRTAEVRANLPATAERDEIHAAIDEVQAADRDVLEPLETAVVDATAALDKATRWYVFRSIGRNAYRDLQKAHPADDDDVAEWAEEGGDGKPPYSFDTFPPALVSVASVDPKLTADDVAAMWASDEWNEAELTLLFQHALAAQTQVRPDPRSRQ